MLDQGAKSTKRGAERKHRVKDKETAEILAQRTGKIANQSIPDWSAFKRVVTGEQPKNPHCTDS